MKRIIFSLLIILIIVDSLWSEEKKDENLINAARWGDLKLVQSLIAHGAEVNSRDDDGETPLHIAAKFNNVPVIRFLVQHKADPNSKNKNGKTPLHFAVIFSRGKIEAVKLLIFYGANVNAKDKIGRTPLYELASVRLFFKNIAEYLISHGVNVNAKDLRKDTPLHYAAGVGNNIGIVKLLVSHNADINAKDLNGDTPLHEAVYGENVEIVKFLVDSGADINVKDKDDKTPLSMAQLTAKISGNNDIVSLLLSTGKYNFKEIKQKKKSVNLHIGEGKRIPMLMDRSHIYTYTVEGKSVKVEKDPSGSLIIKAISKGKSKLKIFIYHFARMTIDEKTGKVRKMSLEEIKKGKPTKVYEIYVK